MPSFTHPPISTVVHKHGPKAGSSMVSPLLATNYSSPVTFVVVAPLVTSTKLGSSVGIVVSVVCHVKNTLPPVPSGATSLH